jgi:hypothetical protein
MTLVFNTGVKFTHIDECNYNGVIKINDDKRQCEFPFELKLMDMEGFAHYSSGSVHYVHSMTSITRQNNPFEDDETPGSLRTDEWYFDVTFTNVSTLKICGRRIPEKYIGYDKSVKILPTDGEIEFIDDELGEFVVDETGKPVYGTLEEWFSNKPCPL